MLTTAFNNNPEIKTTKEDTWKIVEAFFKRCGFVRHHIESFSYFINTIIPETVTSTVCPGFETDRFSFNYIFKNIYIHNPSIIENDGSTTVIYPNDARLRNLAYSSPLFIVIEKILTIKSTNEVVKEKETCYFGNIPIMVRSNKCHLYKATVEELYQRKECEYDQGGYFIINGTEKMLMGMERMGTNQSYVFPNKNDPDDLYCEIASIDEKFKKSPSNFYIHLTVASVLGRRCLRGNINYFKKEFPLGILLKLLKPFKPGQIKNDILSNTMFKNIKGKQYQSVITLIESIEEESFHIDTVNKAYEYFYNIASTQGSTEEKQQSYVDEVLNKEFLPHVGISSDCFVNKYEMLIYMIQKLLLTSYQQIDYDDHDHYKNKRTDESGILLGNIFNPSFSKVVKELNMFIKKKLENSHNIRNLILSPMINNIHLTKDLNYVLATGNWGINKSSKMKTGVSQVFNRFNFQASLSHSRRNINPMPKNSILSRPRQIHNSSWCKICPFESPEGHSIGLVKNKALSASVSIGFSDVIVQERIEMDVVPEDKSQDIYTLLLNGKIMKRVYGIDWYEHLRSLKLDGSFPFDIRVGLDRTSRIIDVRTDSGRLNRPVFVVRDNKTMLTPELVQSIAKGQMTWDDLIFNGVIEIVDTCEEENFLICKNIHELGKDGINYTHCEIHQCLVIGVCSGIIPYGNHDPSARITYQASMSKQSLSIPGMNYEYRMDTMNHVLDYPQKQLNQTAQMGLMNYNDMPAGNNVVLAICTYGGFNQEDSIILNKGSVDRGLFRSTFYRVYKETESKAIGSEEKFGIPEERDVDKLDIMGIVNIGTWVEEGDIIIGKISSSVDTEGNPIKPRSIMIRHGEQGIVDKVMLTVNTDGTRMVKVRVRCQRVIEVGDKLAAPHSQKGVVGAILNQEDMPFNSEGICPDVIINPHCQPSRMTTGHLMEIHAGKYSSVSGKFADATIFSKRDFQEVCTGLRDLGYQENGWERLYNGMTGEMMDAKIFVGVCYYQRLKHMVADKIHSRGIKGPISSLTHQPSDGRSREGGLRIGEMERDCFISLGASALLQERLMNLSDPYHTYVCDKCGLLCMGNHEKKIYMCKACNSDSVSVIKLPYATKLLIMELYSVNVALRLRLESDGSIKTC